MKRKIQNFFRNKGFYLTVALGVLAIGGAVGVANYQSKQQEEQLTENAADFTQIPDETDYSASNDHSYDMDYTEGYNADEVQKILNDLRKESTDEAQAANSKEVTGEAAANPDKKDTNDQKETKAEDQTESMDATEDAQTTFSGYDGSRKMNWPLTGSVVLDYSMDSTVYYKTLDQYKCSPGMLIAAEANTPVAAVYEGTVKSVSRDAVYGNVIVVDMGNGYEASYGQVKDVLVKEGDMVAQGQRIASVAQPTKYFTQEGCHLNFMMTKDGEPQNPSEFME